jgi:ABC-type transporter Mla MlaB component
MLRIYIHDEVPVTSFVVEGKLVGPWVKELERCWESVVAAHPYRSMQVDLTHVTFIDSEGRALLTRMRRKGVKLLSAGVLINAIVAEIEAEHGKDGVEKSHEDQKQSILLN